MEENQQRSNTNRIIGYSRPSSQREQKDTMALAEQEQACRDYCEKNGLTVVAVYSEEA